MRLNIKSICRIGLPLSLFGIVISGFSVLPKTEITSIAAAATTDVPHPPMDEVWTDDSDLQLDDDLGIDNPTWEDYEQDANIEFEENQNKNEEEDDNNNNTANLPQLGQFYSNDQATYVVTKTGITGGTVEYRAPVGEVSSVNIPDYVLIEESVFDVTSIAAKAFRNNQTLQAVSSGSMVTTIGASAFSGCSSLKTVIIAGDLKSIGNNAFYNCEALSRLSLPATVNKIGKKAFAGCKALKNITIKSKTLKAGNIGSKAFSDISKEAVIKVPKAKVKTYRKLFREKGLNAKAKVKAI